MWYRVSPSISPPIGWEIVDGRPWSSVPNAMGPGLTSWTTGNMPDMRNKFVLGAATTGTGSDDPTLPPDIGAVGGLHRRDFTHTHTVAHFHNVNTHTHPMDHTHGLIINAAGSHAHTFAGGHVVFSRQNAFQSGIAVSDYATRHDVTQLSRVNNLESLYLAGFGGGFDPGGMAGMDASGNHAHTGSTGGASTINTGGSSAHTTDTQTPTTSAGTLGTLKDIRPEYIGILYIMRVL
jgi:hypothetical protein